MYSGSSDCSELRDAILFYILTHYENYQVGATEYPVKFKCNAKIEPAVTSCNDWLIAEEIPASYYNNINATSLNLDRSKPIDKR